MPKGHVVTAILRTGERVPHVFILNGRELLGIYDRLEAHFTAQDIADVEPILLSDLIPYQEFKWFRLDIFHN